MEDHICLAAASPPPPRGWKVCPSSPPVVVGGLLALCGVVGWWVSLRKEGPALPCGWWEFWGHWRGCVIHISLCLLRAWPGLGSGPNAGTGSGTGLGLSMGLVLGLGLAQDLVWLETSSY